MAKKYKHADKICLIMTITAAVGIIIGLSLKTALIPILALLPSTIYAVYRTEGKSTKAASWGMLGVLIVELLLIIFNININVAEFLQRSEGTIAGYTIPFADLQVLTPAVLGVLSVVLIKNTWGKYTTWLAGINLAGAFAIIYILDPTIFSQLIQTAIDEGIKQIE
jgi:hypothetical protein